MRRNTTRVKPGPKPHAVKQAEQMLEALKPGGTIPAEPKTVSLGALFACSDTIAEERKKWRVVPVGFGDGEAVAVRSDNFEEQRFPTKGLVEANHYVRLRCIAAGLESLGLKVEPLA